MAEDCIRWTQREPGVSASRSGFAIHRGGQTVGRPEWSLSFRGRFLRRFNSKREAVACAEDALRVVHGMIERSTFESRYGIDMDTLWEPEVTQ